MQLCEYENQTVAPQNFSLLASAHDCETALQRVFTAAMLEGCNNQTVLHENLDLISQGKENVLFLPSNMAAMTSHENAV